MIIGIPKEIKNNENRVSLTPAGAGELVRRGHTVYVQSSAGVGSGFSDAQYEQTGARILPSIEAVSAFFADFFVLLHPYCKQDFFAVRIGDDRF